ncbi:hypothetical protein D9758_010045 [Tetrapyrgos nigripes]|uniref:SUZ domain-containing protein n=1 Tax=Tetrapyrgos nigripes TaxID=182062 RepID=A0A8H5CUY6_9AGAR|nr:hypothetical protein D9758_010045 [Tetrapyrgos nigripes]
MALPSSSGSDWDGVQTPEMRRRPVVAVRDDWEDEDEEQDVPNGEVNRKIWEEADRKASEPMPILVASSSSRPVAAPPAAAFQPVLKILKRPQSNPNSPPPTISASTSAESFQEREARYQAARNRIFGESASPSPDSASSSTTSLPLASSISREDRSKASANSPPATSVSRNPRGPESEGGRNSPRGFQGRRSKQPQTQSSCAEVEDTGVASSP